MKYKLGCNNVSHFNNISIIVTGVSEIRGSLTLIKSTDYMGF